MSEDPQLTEPPTFGRIGAITLFVEDLSSTKRFYREALGLPIHFEDDDSAVFDFDNTLVNLLRTEAVPELIAPVAVADRGAGARFQLTVEVDDVDATSREPLQGELSSSMARSIGRGA